MTIFLAILGGFLFAIVPAISAAMWLINRWISKDCLFEGPDFIKKQLPGQWRAGIILMLILWGVFAAADFFLFTRNDALYDGMNRTFDDWPIGSEKISWPLWVGTFLGGFIGITLGQRLALTFGKHKKCRHVLSGGFRLMPW